MNYLLLCFVVTFSIGVIADRLTLKIEEAQDFCKDLAEIGQTLIDQARNGQFSNDQKLKDYYKCYGISVQYLRVEQRSLIGIQNVQVTTIDKNALRDWMVDKLQYDSKTIEHALTSCSVDEDDPDIFQPVKCLSENKLPVDVVSANYVDRSAEEMLNYQDHCKKIFNVDQNSIAKAQKGTIDDSITLARYYACYSFLAGFFKDWGEFDFYNLEKWLKISLKYDSVEVDFALYKCYKADVEDNDEIFEEIMKIIKCFADEHVPIDVMANQIGA